MTKTPTIKNTNQIKQSQVLNIGKEIRKSFINNALLVPLQSKQQLESTSK